MCTQFRSSHTSNLPLGLESNRHDIDHFCMSHSLVHVCMYLQRTDAGHATGSRNPFSSPFTHSWHQARHELAPQPYRQYLYVCSYKGQRDMEPVLRIHSQTHSLIHGTRPGTSAYHSPAGNASQILKPHTEYISTPYAQRHTQPAQSICHKHTMVHHTTSKTPPADSNDP